MHYIYRANTDKEFDDVVKSNDDLDIKVIDGNP
jgi:hypothetical protein